MGSSMTRLFSLPVVVTLVLGVLARSGDAQITPEQVRKSIEQGVEYLRKEQQPNGSFGEVMGQPGGLTALCTLALLNSGVDVKDATIQKALNYLRKVEPERTYQVSLQTMVFCRAEPERDRLLIGRNVRWLERTQVEAEPTRGSWSYPGMSGDNSNAQFALLALHDAERVGAVVQERTWRLAKAYWESTQNPDGSWGYRRGLPGTGSMTCAGLTSMIIAAGQLQEPDAKVDGDRIECCQRSDAETDSIQRAIQWMERNFSVTHNPGTDQRWLLYYLYGLERVGRMTNRRFFGKHDWYREGADFLIQLKAGQGADLTNRWSGKDRSETNDSVATSFALLFLSKGRWPVLMSKLRHGPEEDWNSHRSDVANLTRYVEAKWKRDLVWQIVDPGPATVEDLLQSPVLYYCGVNSPLPSGAAEQETLARKLRDYVDRGGFIVAEAYCGGAGFDEGFRKLMERVFPEPEYRLQVLPPEHPIWYAEEEVPASQIRPVLGVEYGCRTSVVYFPPDKVARPSLSCLWELKYGGRDRTYSQSVQEQINAGVSLGINILAYATNRELIEKEGTWTAQTAKPADEIDRGKLYVASLKHPGGCAAAPRALTNLLNAAGDELKIRVNTEPRELPMTDPSLFNYHLVFMHGRTAFRLTDAERKQLRKFLERGGMIFANSICASKQFAESFRREMKSILPEEDLKSIPVSDPLLTSAYGGFDLSTVTRRDPQGRQANQPMKVLERKGPPELEGIKLNNRYAVIFSPYDLSCALEKQETIECQGYTRESAGRIGLNVILYSLQH